MASKPHDSQNWIQKKLEKIPKRPGFGRKNQLRTW
jgi:hypothetical protein